MQFSSRPPYNDDPAPYVVMLTKRTPFSNPMTTGSVDEFLREDERVHDPRPQYERPQHNPTNRLLTAARYAHAEGYLLDFCEGFLSERNTEHLEIDHAQRVLTKWRYLSKVES